MKKRKIFLNRSCPYILMQIHRADFIVVIVAEVSDVADGPLCMNNCNYYTNILVTTSKKC